MSRAEDTPPPASWRIYVGGDPVGRLISQGFDQPWVLCKFEPLPGWSSKLQGLFEAQNEAARNGFPPDQMWPIKEIRDKGVELRSISNVDEEAFTPLIVYIENGEARFRG